MPSPCNEFWEKRWKRSKSGNVRSQSEEKQSIQSGEKAGRQERAEKQTRERGGK
jgi:hypothetical protein